MSARDARYGRRGGRWASEGAGHLAGELSQALAEWRAGGGRMVDRSERSHPDTIATARAHDRGCSHRSDEPCLARPDPDDLDDVWAGRARMARARAAADRPLDRTDREALFRAGDIDHV